MKRLALLILFVLFGYTSVFAIVTFSGISNSPFTSTVNVNQHGGITAAASDAATAGKTLVVSDAQTLTANTTISADRALVITKGGSITKASTYTLTINGPFDTGDYQVFSGFSAGDITGLKEARPEWWGGAGDNSTDNTTPIAAALASLTKGVVKLLPGIYVKTGTAWSLKDNVIIEGSGKYVTLIDNQSNNDVFQSTGTSGNYIEYTGIKNLGITTTTSSTGDIVDATYTRYSIFTNNLFYYHARGIYLHTNCYYNHITQNTFLAQTSRGIHENNFGGNYIIGNVFDGNTSNTPILLYIDSNSNQTVVQGNTFSGSAAVGISILGTCRSTTITGNSFSEMTTNAITLTDYFGAYPIGTAITGNTFRNMASISDSVIRLNGGGRYTTISGNTFDGNHASNPDIKIDISAAYTTITGNVSNDTTFLSDSSSTTSVGLNTHGAKGSWLSGSVTWDPASLDDGVGEISGDITVTGATLGDFCIVSAPYDLQGAIATCYVQAADTVKIRLQNESGGTLNFDSGTWRVRTLKQ